MKYQLKLTVTISLLIALAFGIGGTAMILTSFRTGLQQETQAALASFETVQKTLYLLYSTSRDYETEGIKEALQQMQDQHLGQWEALSLTEGTQTVFQDNGAQLASCCLPLPDANSCVYRIVSDAFGQGILVAGSLPTGDGSLVLTARFDLSPVYATRQVQQRLYWTVYLAVVAFGILASTVLAYVLTRPLRRLTRTARRISGGDLSRRSGIRTPDEIGQLSRDFDAMADKLQENISGLEAQLQRQERFMGAFAHELKTPMTSIIGFADLLRQGNMDENTRMMTAEYIYSEGRRLERLSFKLLDLLLLQKDQLECRQVPLDSFVGEIQRAMAPVLKKKNIRLICRAPAKKAAFEPDLVKSLVYNLIDNAAKAMEEGGLIALQARTSPDGCQFQITDNGCGMEEKELSRITEAFYRVDKARSRSQGGAGLGLALCRQIVELHDGSIHFASTPGKGTCVTVTLYGKVGKERA